jgi:hypothetical protein
VTLESGTLIEAIDHIIARVLLAAQTLLGELECYDAASAGPEAIMIKLASKPANGLSRCSRFGGYRRGDIQLRTATAWGTRYVARWDPLRDPLDAGLEEKQLATATPSIASSEGSWRVLHSGFGFRPPSQAGRRGFESHRPLFGSS